MNLKLKKDTVSDVSSSKKAEVLKKILNKKVIAVICAIAVAGSGFAAYKIKSGGKSEIYCFRKRKCI